MFRDFRCKAGCAETDTAKKKASRTRATNFSSPRDENFWGENALSYLRFLLAFVAMNRLLAADMSYKIDTIAGSDYVGDNGAATSALLFQADGIAADSQGNLYVSDAANHRIRK